MILHDRSQRVTPPYSLVVSDLRMPGLSGIELHDRIETSGEIIEKPFEFSKLRATIDKVLGR